MSTTAEGVHVYLGPWINWSSGPILGSTITLSARSGGLLTSFLGVFVTVVSGQLWRILSFVFHQIRATRGPRDGLHHQYQNIFKNTNSPGGATYSFALLAIHWWKHASHPLLRSLPWIIFGLAYMIAFGLAGVFSSEVTKAAGKNRLILGPNCGFLETTGTELQQLIAYQQKTLNDSILASNYARACYDGSFDPLVCSTYAATQIPFEAGNATCPFKDNICLSGTPAYKMDTGIIDSAAILGINSPKSRRLGYRKVSTCAPLEQANYTEFINGSTSDDPTINPKYDFIRYNYGSGLTGVNYTFQYNTATITTWAGYIINPLMSFAGLRSAWDPIDALNRTDADVTLILLTFNALEFRDQVNDPVFAVHLEGNTIDSDAAGGNITFYQSDHYGGVLACAEQHQICNVATDTCTKLVGSQGIIPEALKLDLSAFQQGILGRISSVSTFLNLYASVEGRPQNLRAQETVSDLIQGPLPDNQWQIELSYWYSTLLARLQRGFVEFATGPPDNIPNTSIYKPQDITSKELCYSQMVKSTDATISFSVLGVAIILVVGTLIIITNQLLDMVAGFIQKRVVRWDYARLNWILDDKLQLQRMVYEEVGMGTWSGATATVPVTLKGEIFGGWEGVDPGHPRLHRRDSMNGLPEHVGLMHERKPSAADDVTEYRPHPPTYVE